MRIAMDLYIAGFWSLLSILTILAWIWRRRDTRGHLFQSNPALAVVALFWMAAMLTAVLRPSLETRFHNIEPALLVIDFGLFVGLTWIGARSGKGWVLCAAALQLISATAHVARLTTPGMWRLGYQVMEEASSYPTLLLLGWGLASHRFGTKRYMRWRS